MNSNTRDEPQPGLDPGIAIATLLLIGLGVVTSYSATAALALESAIPPLFFDHLVGLLIGAAATFAAYHLPAKVVRHGALPLWGVSVALLIATLVAGVEVNGAQRWLSLPGLRFQPGELAKCATLIAVAAYIAVLGCVAVMINLASWDPEIFPFVALVDLIPLAGLIVSAFGGTGNQAD